MTKKSKNFDNVTEEIENFPKDLNFEKNTKNQDFDIDNKLNIYDNQINYLNQEIIDFKEIISKTKEYLLLELESNLDKHKQIQLKNENKYEELIILLKNDNNDKFSSLNEEIGKLKQIIIGKNELIEILKNEKNESYDEISLLNEKINTIIKSKDAEINKLNEEKNIEINNLS
ncbi:hypothetical protein, partial [uncultured Methanobrevibacter sp.]